MRRSAVNEREHRRGLVLGLTLAEVLLLLLFLVLLALASRVFQLRDAVKDRERQLTAIQEKLGPVLDKAKNSGEIDLPALREIGERLSRLTNLERDNETLKSELSETRAKLAVFQKLGPRAEKMAEDIAPLWERASRINRDDPPAALKRAVDLLEHTPASVKPEDLKSLSSLGDVTATIRELHERVATTETERDRFRRERDNLMRSRGGGLQYPSCWTNEKGETEYIFDITFRDAGLIVSDHSLDTRKNDEAWKLVDSFSRQTIIRESEFAAATDRLFQWSKVHDCRFVVIVRDQTGENKSRYKALMRTVEGHFYKNELTGRRQSVPPPRREVSASPSESSSSSSDSVRASEAPEVRLPPHHIGARQEPVP